MRLKNIHLLLAAALAGCICALSCPDAAAAEPHLLGAGAIFPFPIYATWFTQFARDPKVRDAFNGTGARVDYEADDSTAGVADLIGGKVDFAASDTAISNKEIGQVERGVVPLPTTAGAIVLAYNLPDVGALRLPRQVYPKIFAGDISTWNDPAIVTANPDVALPDLPITVVVRADAARATRVLTAHLSALDPDFRQAVGTSRSPKWPEQDNFMTATMNDGVAALLARVPGAIGYMDVGYARLAHWQFLALLENKAGNYVAADPESSAATLAEAKFPARTLPSGAPDLRGNSRDPHGANAYPIVAMTWLLFYAKGYQGEQLAAVHDLIQYCTSAAAQGQAAGLGYVPLPENIIERVEKAAGFIQ
ncbi:MAG: phosphate ABC transporter substrate-binding protein PstS [Thiohalocapsa sp.]|jgi:phosphate transport system substrate-binding protein|uniref:phosphate ABC transporter substrate-binding protein PstS n=1 Tax=Thiohalocapsa sp. TaxID=2497641 RepID=UPI0025E992A1|nr:phosphate ABC transporter substrate-binding protein PstS [Thiohalocapsa sp.]MCG6939801.1 phosphate ABC transporter substrate-binding protein PstS [Thiohalocapsa sp.]